MLFVYALFYCVLLFIKEFPDICRSFLITEILGCNAHSILDECRALIQLSEKKKKTIKSIFTYMARILQSGLCICIPYVSYQIFYRYFQVLLIVFYKLLDFFFFNFCAYITENSITINRINII